MNKPLIPPATPACPTHTAAPQESRARHLPLRLRPGASTRADTTSMPKCCGHLAAGQRPLAQPEAVRERLKDALVVHRQHRPVQALTPYWHLGLRPRRMPRILSDLCVRGVAAVRSQHRVDPPAGDRPPLPFLLGRGQLGLDAVDLLAQPVDSTSNGELGRRTVTVSSAGQGPTTWPPPPLIGARAAHAPENRINGTVGRGVDYGNATTLLGHFGRR